MEDEKEGRKETWMDGERKEGRGREEGKKSARLESWKRDEWMNGLITGPLFLSFVLSVCFIFAFVCL